MLYLKYISAIEVISIFLSGAKMQEHFYFLGVWGEENINFTAAMELAADYCT